MQLRALVALKAHLQRLPSRAVQAHIRDAIEPVLTLLIKVGVVQECAALDDIAANVAHRPLDFALGLRARADRPAA